MADKRFALGKGLSALIPGAEAKSEARDESSSFEVAVERITPSPLQPRRAFDEAKIAELASSIHNQGIIQPFDDGLVKLGGRPFSYEFNFLAEVR